jgi:hypothetical protein
MGIILLMEFSRLGHDKSTGTELEIEWLIDIPALLEELVFPHNTHVGDPAFHVSRNVTRPEYEESELPIAILVDQAP